LHDVKAIPPESVRGTGGNTSFSERGDLCVQLDGQVVAIPAHVADFDRLPSQCNAVLGVPAIADLAIDLPAQLRLDGDPDQVFQCFLGEKKTREWLEANEGASIETKPFDLDEIAVNPELSEEIIARIRALIQRFASVFDSSTGNLPKPFSCGPVRLNFIPNFAPQSTPEPRWTHAQAKAITKRAEDCIANGSCEHSKSAWASRPHVVVKPPSGLRAADAPVADCKLRVCGDYGRRMVNTIQKLTPNLPTGAHELEKAAGHHFYFESDSVACFNW
jgi:hypothetical protein